VSINVLVVDDSALMRKIISDTLSSDPGIQIVGKASNGIEAIDKISKLDPDVVTMDIQMPEMDGLTALKKIMEISPRPVVMIASKSSDDSDITVQSLEAGAIDFILKPSQNIQFDKTFRDDLITKIKIAVMSKPRKAQSMQMPVAHHSFLGAVKKIVAIGTSTGGPQTLEQIIPMLPKNIPACVLVVQHMPAGFTKSLAERFSKISQIEVKEAAEGDEIREGIVYIAPGDFHMTVERIIKNGIFRDQIKLNQDEKECGVRPSVNVMMRSVAALYKDKVIGLVLTGMGSDGTDGSMIIKKNGGTIMVQDEKSSIIYGMPKSVLLSGYYDEVVELSKIPVSLIQLLEL
jgi:two-component system, chemotaxis family, protein-glutamate methylesterase/glutaminase